MKNLIKYLFALVGLFTLGSCVLDDEVVDFGQGPIVVQFPNKTGFENFLQDGSGAVYDYKIPVQYFGGSNQPLDKDVTVTVSVSPDSEAKEGVEFSIPNKQLIIPAGTNVDTLVVKVNSAVLDASNPKKMILMLNDSSEKVSNNQNVTAITLQAVCPSELSGNYVYTTGNGRAVEVKSTGVGTYTVGGDDAFGSAYPFYISDVCGKLTVTGGYIADNFGIPVSGNGYVDQNTGNLIIYYTVDGYLTNREMILKKQ